MELHKGKKRKISKRVGMWFNAQNKDTHAVAFSHFPFRPFLIEIIPFLALIRNSPLKFLASQIHKRRVPKLPTDHPTPPTVTVSKRVL